MAGFKIVASFFVILSLMEIQVFADDEPHRILPLGHKIKKESVDKCLKDAGVTKEQLTEAGKEFHESKGASVSKNVLCFIKCMGEEIGTVGSDGKIDIQKIKETIPPKMEEKLDELTECLEKIDKISSCDDMQKVIQCIPH